MVQWIESLAHYFTGFGKKKKSSQTHGGGFTTSSQPATAPVGVRRHSPTSRSVL
jgi:hypothetical protein